MPKDSAKNRKSFWNSTNPSDSYIKALWWLSLTIHLYAALQSIGYHGCDEYFQIIEPVANNTSVWEFRDRIRPWFQIAFFKAILFPFQAFGLTNPFIKMTILRICCSLLGFFSLNLLWKWWIQNNKEANPIWSYTVIHFLWYIPYFHARTSAENLGTSLLLFSLLLFHNRNTSLIAGVLGGLSFWTRFHLGIPVFALWVWSLSQTGLSKKNILFPLGVVLTLLLGIGLDSYFYEKLTITPYRYFYVNLIKDRASDFGVNPWYDYFRWAFLRGIPPLSLFLFGSLLWHWLKKPRHLITVLTLPFFLIHLLVPHKESRFLFPLLPFVALALLSFIPSFPVRYRSWKKYTFRFCLIINIVTLIISINISAKKQFKIQHEFYRRKINTLASFKRDPYQACQLDMKFTKPQNLKVSIFNENTPRPPQAHVVFYRYGQDSQFSWIKDCRLDWQSTPEFLLNILPKNIPFNIKAFPERKKNRLRVTKLYYCGQKNNAK